MRVCSARDITIELDDNAHIKYPSINILYKLGD